MRVFALVALSILGLGAAVPAALAAELDAPRNTCARGQVWDGYRCAWPAPQARRYYNPPQAYVPDDEDDYVAEAPPVYVAPPVYSYAVPYYRPPVVSYYAYAGPRYYGGGGWGRGHGHGRWWH